MSSFPRRYGEIDNIQLNVINIRNNDNSLPSTGYIATQTSSGLRMLSIVYALDTIPGLSDLSGNLSSVSTTAGYSFSTINAVSTATSYNTSTITGQSTLIGYNQSSIVSLAETVSVGTSTIQYLSTLAAQNNANLSTISSIANEKFSTIGELSTLNSTNFGLVTTLSSQVSSLTSSFTVLSTLSGENAVGISTLSTTYGVLSVNMVSLVNFYSLSSAVLVQSSQISTLQWVTSTNIYAISTLSANMITLSSYISTVSGTQVSRPEFQALSTTVLDQSTQIGVLGSTVSTNIQSVSTLSSQVASLSTSVGSGSGQVSIASFQGLSTTVLGQSTQIGQIWPSLCTTIVNLSSLSSYVITLSTLAGSGGGGGGGGGGSYATRTEFEGLSTTVLGQSTQLGNISLSLSASIVNLSSLSSYVLTLSTSVGGGFTSIGAYQGLSTYVLGQSTTIRNVSDSLCTNVANLSSLSSYVLTLSTIAGSTNYVTLPAFQGLSTYVLGQSTQIGNIDSNICTSIVAFSTLSSYVAVLSTTFGISTNVYVGNSSNLTYGAGNVAGAVGAAAGGANNSVTASNATAIGERNSATATAAAAFGYSTTVTAPAAFAVGQYAVGRIPSAFTCAGGALSTSGGLMVAGSAQTYIYNLFGMTATCNVYAPLGYFSNLAPATLQSNVPITVAGGGGYLMQTVDVRLTGYETPVGSVGGNGIYFSRHQFNAYWDNTISRNLYICDASGVASNSSNILSTLTVPINKLDGAPTITAIVYPTASPASWALAVRASSSNTINWLAQITSGELLSA